MITKTILLLLGILAFLSALIFLKKYRYHLLIVVLVLPIPIYGLIINISYDIALTIVAVSILIIERQMPTLPQSLYKFPLGLLFVAAILGGIISEQPEFSFLELLRYLKYYLFYVMIVYLLYKTKDIRPLIYSLAAGIMLASIQGILQFIFVGSFLFYEPFEMNTNTASMMSGELAVRIMGPFNNSLNFANYLSILSPLCIYYLFSVKKQHSKKIAITLTVVITAVLLLTISRAAIIAYMFVFIFLIAEKHWLRGFIVFALILGLLYVSSNFLLEILLPKSISERFLSAVEDLQNARIALWINSFPMFLDHPLLGVGLGNLNYVGYYHYGFVSDREAATFLGGHVENTYLSILYTLGLMGFMGFIAIIVKSIKKLLTFVFDVTNMHYRAISQGLLLSWLSYAINISTNPAVIIDLRNGIILWVLMAATRFLDFTDVPNANPVINIHEGGNVSHSIEKS